MSEKTKPTPGLWHTGGIFNPGTPDRYCSIWSNPKAGEQSGDQIAQYVRPEDAALICEAANLYHETGYTPRQLMQQRDELLAALERMLMHSKSCVSQLHPNEPLGDFNWIIQAKEAIAKATGAAP